MAGAIGAAAGFFAARFLVLFFGLFLVAGEAFLAAFFFGDFLAVVFLAAAFFFVDFFAAFLGAAFFAAFFLVAIALWAPSVIAPEFNFGSPSGRTERKGGHEN